MSSNPKRRPKLSSVLEVLQGHFLGQYLLDVDQLRVEWNKFRRKQSNTATLDTDLCKTFIMVVYSNTDITVTTIRNADGTYRAKVDRYRTQPYKR